jgi:hypothetical protein
MGYVIHQAIVVTSWEKELREKARAKAVELGMCVSDMTKEVTNGYASFMVAPDGSKEGWSESDEGDTKREMFKRWLDAQRYGDGSTSLEWAEVSYGSDDKDARVIQHAWTKDVEDDAA